jgi:hypothetical protein
MNDGSTDKKYHRNTENFGDEHLPIMTPNTKRITKNQIMVAFALRHPYFHLTPLVLLLNIADSDFIFSKTSQYPFIDAKRQHDTMI